MRRQVGGAILSPDFCVTGFSGGFLFRLSALRTAQLFTRQLFMKGLATNNADLAAFVFSAHTYDCGEPRLSLAKVRCQPASNPSIPGSDSRGRRRRSGC